MSHSYTLSALAEALAGELVGDGTITVNRLAHPADLRGAGDLALVMDEKLLPLLNQGTARAAVISKNTKLETGVVEASIVVSRPRLAMAILTRMFSTPVPFCSGIHPTAIVESGVTLGKNISVGAYSFVGAGAVIGDNSILHPQTYICAGAVLGADSLIYPGVKIGGNVRIGDRCIIHFNTSIGADGFSYVTPEPGSVEQAKSGSSGHITNLNSHLVRIYSLGGVIIGDDVEIGANTSIDQGTVMPTRIGHGTKIDNLVQVGHNVTIGDSCLICGGVGIAGSVVIGNRVVLGGAVGVADHVKIGDNVVVMGMSGVSGPIKPNSVVGGMPARPREKMMENYFNLSRLKSFFQKVDTLVERVDRLDPDGKKST
jgi:UDP-3-O-[3-hydroxymyristoyl] glucosamine N-acyltransferase